MQNLQEVESYLATLIPRSQSFGDRLAHVISVLEHLGSPQNKIPAIHIAGTSGKGSTAYYAAAMLHEAGYSVGLTVSPHVSKVSERVQVNGELLPDDVFCAYITEFVHVIDELNETVTYVEFLDCFAYWLFAKLKLDYMVIEVGLGGRLDPTNVISRQSTVRVITDIGFDHTEILGNTLDAIAMEKAGIIHDGDVVCMYPQGELVMGSVNAAVQEHRARLAFVDDVGASVRSPVGYQGRNWVLAAAAVRERLLIDKKELLSEAQLRRSTHYTIPGRFEVFTNDKETIILDVAHNPQKMKAFVDTLRKVYPGEYVIAIVSLGENKRSTAAETLSILVNAVDELVATEFSVNAGQPHGPLAAHDVASSTPLGRTTIRKEPRDALVYARAIAQKHHGSVVITGSFYLVSGVRDDLIREFGRTK